MAARIPTIVACRRGIGRRRAMTSGWMGAFYRRGGGTVPVWTPASLSPKWWAEPLDLAQVTYNTQPTINDPSYDDAGAWSQSGGGTGTIEVSGGKARFSSITATSLLFQNNATLVVGNRYEITLDIDTIDPVEGSPYVTGYSGAYASPTIKTSGINVTYVVPTLARIGVAATNGIVTAHINSIAYENLSINALVPDAASSLSGSFTNATAAEMPWINQSTSWIEFDGTADNLAYNGSLSDFKFLHYSATNPGNYPSFTIVIPLNASSLAAARSMLAITPGVTVDVLTDGSVQVDVRDSVAGVMARATSAAGAVAIDIPTVMMITSDGSALRVYLDGIEVASDTSYSGTPTNDDPTIARFGKYSTTYFAGTMCPPLFLDYAADADQRDDLWTYYSEALSIPLATDALSDAELLTWSGLKFWLDPTNASDVTYNTQPSVTDGDMEAADTSAWAVGSSATLSKESGAPGGTGSQVLRVAYNGTNNPYAYQNVMIVGNRYAGTGWARGDGTGYPSVWLGGFIWTGTSSTSWQSISGDETTVSTNMRLYCNINTAGYSEFDNIVITNISINSIADRAGVSSAFTQATAANMPWIDSTTGAMRFDGVSDYLASADAATYWNFLHDGSGATVFCVAKTDEVLPNLDLGHIDNLRNNASRAGFSISANPSQKYVTLSVGNGTGTFAYQATTSNGVITEGNPYLTETIVSSAVVRLDIDGTNRLLGVPTSPGGSASAVMYVGAWSTTPARHWNGIIGDTVVFNRVLSNTERYRLRVKLAAKWSISL